MRRGKPFIIATARGSVLSACFGFYCPVLLEGNSWNKWCAGWGVSFRKLWASAGSVQLYSAVLMTLWSTVISWAAQLANHTGMQYVSTRSTGHLQKERSSFLDRTLRKCHCCALLISTVVLVFQVSSLSRCRLRETVSMQSLLLHIGWGTDPFLLKSTFISRLLLHHDDSFATSFSDHCVIVDRVAWVDGDSHITVLEIAFREPFFSSVWCLKEMSLWHPCVCKKGFC